MLLKPFAVGSGRPPPQSNYLLPLNKSHFSHTMQYHAAFKKRTALVGMAQFVETWICIRERKYYWRDDIYISPVVPFDSKNVHALLFKKTMTGENKLARMGPGCHLLWMRPQAFPTKPIKSNRHPASSHFNLSCISHQNRLIQYSRNRRLSLRDTWRNLKEVNSLTTLEWSHTEAGPYHHLK